MNKEFENEMEDELRPEYDFANSSNIVFYFLKITNAFLTQKIKGR